MEQKALLKSQRELIAIRLAQAQAAQNEALAAINNAATELGLNIEDKWTLSKDLLSFEKRETPAPK
jgi:hypothetical protein